MDYMTDSFINYKLYGTLISFDYSWFDFVALYYMFYQFEHHTFGKCYATGSPQYCTGFFLYFKGAVSLTQSLYFCRLLSVSPCATVWNRAECLNTQLCSFKQTEKMSWFFYIGEKVQRSWVYFLLHKYKQPQVSHCCVMLKDTQGHFKCKLVTG